MSGELYPRKMSVTLLFCTTLAAALTVMPSTVWAQAAAEHAILSGMSTGSTMTSAKGMSRMGRRLGPLVVPKVKLSDLEANRKKLEEKSAQGGGTLHIASNPDKALVFVDDEPVANTPVDLKVPEGKHYIMLRQGSNLPWEKEITIKPGEPQSINAKLEAKYKSSLSVSFDK